MNFSGPDLTSMLRDTGCAMADEKDFSKRLCDTLSAYFPPTESGAEVKQGVATSSGTEELSPWAARGDAIIPELLDVARWAREELREIETESTCQQLRKEQRLLATALRTARDALGNLSADLDRLLGTDADPAACAAALDALLPVVDDAASRIAALPRSKRPVEKEGTIATEFAVRVARVLMAHDMKASASGGSYYNYSSPAVEILGAIGAEIGLVRTRLAWRDVLAEAKSANPDPQFERSVEMHDDSATRAAQDKKLTVNAIRFGLASPAYELRQRRARAKKSGPSGQED
jgi:hypothetical protein